MIAGANALVIVFTLYYKWSLLEIALAYAGEFLILGLIACARILVAQRLTVGRGGAASAWRLRGAKAVDILTTIVMICLFTGLPVGMLFLVGALGEGAQRLQEIWRPLALCWAAFLCSHAMGFVRMFRQGGYRVLVDDSRVMALLWRYLPLLVTAIGAGAESQGLPIQPWFVVAMLAAMAIVDSAVCILEIDADEAALASRPAAELAP